MKFMFDFFKENITFDSLDGNFIVLAGAWSWCSNNLHWWCIWSIFCWTCWGKLRYSVLKSAINDLHIVWMYALALNRWVIFQSTYLGSYPTLTFSGFRLLLQPQRNSLPTIEKIEKWLVQPIFSITLIKKLISLFIKSFSSWYNTPYDSLSHTYSNQYSLNWNTSCC